MNEFFGLPVGEGPRLYGDVDSVGAQDVFQDVAFVQRLVLCDGPAGAEFCDELVGTEYRVKQYQGLNHTSTPLELNGESGADAPEHDPRIL